MFVNTKHRLVIFPKHSRTWKFEAFLPFLAIYGCQGGVYNSGDNIYHFTVVPLTTEDPVYLVIGEDWLTFGVRLQQAHQRLIPASTIFPSSPCRQDVVLFSKHNCQLRALVSIIHCDMPGSLGCFVKPAINNCIQHSLHGCLDVVNCTVDSYIGCILSLIDVHVVNTVQRCTAQNKEVNAKLRWLLAIVLSHRTFPRPATDTTLIHSLVWTTVKRPGWGSI